MPKPACVHVAGQRATCPDYVEYTARRCLRAQNGTGACELLAEDDESATIFLRVASALPFVSPHFCYRVMVENEEGLNNTVRMNGCLDVKCDMAETGRAAILRDAVNEAGVKNFRRKVEVCMGRAGLDDAGFASHVWATFCEAPERKALMAALKRRLGAASGWFTRETRHLGAALYCMGFCNRDLLTRELQAVEGAQGSWFLSLGDADPEWKKLSGIDQRYETFGAFMRSFNGRRSDFITCVEKLIKMDAERFFCTNTRPMALRALGALDKDFFVAYCTKLEPPLIMDADRLVSVDPESFNDEVFVAATTCDKVFATCALESGARPMTVQRCAVTAMTSLVVAQQKRKLRFVREHELAAEIAGGARRLVNWHAHDFGNGGGICEVHILCATRQICLVFSEARVRGAPHGEAAAKAFVCGNSERCDAHIFFRDAHLLACNVFAHLMWRLSTRVNFTGITMSHRCSGDRAYHSLMWDFMRRLKDAHPQGPPIASRTLSDDATISVSGFEGPALAHLEGVCVVPAAMDACCLLDPVAGDHAFTINPPLFGQVTRTFGNTFFINTQFGEKEVPRFLFKQKTNVLKCKRTAKGAYMVPASALLTLRGGPSSTKLASVTVLLPGPLSAEWKEDMLALSHAVATRVKVVVVEAYTVMEDTDKRVDKLVKIVQDSLLIN